RIAYAPVQKVQIRIVGSCHPGCAGPGLPTVSSPRFMARLARTRNRPETPGAVASLCVIGVEKAANARFTAAGPNDDLVIDSQRRNCNGVTDGVVGNDFIPPHCARFCIECHQMSVKSADEDSFTQKSHTSVHGWKPQCPNILS